jgi:catechol 2,3-dioxygenase-like lactoylglutathione lyase family enzyme
MGVQRFDHAAINCRSIEKSEQFYTQILGLKKGRSVDMGDKVLHYLELPDQSSIELFEHKDRACYDSLAAAEGSLKHFAFRVDNIDELNQKLLDAGVTFTMNLCALRRLQVKALLCLDPDGVIVELCQPL